MTDASPSTAPNRQRLRIRFRKEGLLRWISHHDLMRTFERLLRRAALRLRMSEGFHPKPKLRFPSALALGIEGLEELVELDLEEVLDTADVHRRLASQSPPGLVITQVQVVPEGNPKARIASMDYAFSVPEPRRRQVEQAIRELLAQPTLSVRRYKQEQPIEVPVDLEYLELSDGHLHFRIAASHGASIRPRDILMALGLDDLEQQGYCLRRTQVELVT